MKKLNLIFVTAILVSSRNAVSAEKMETFLDQMIQEKDTVLIEQAKFDSQYLKYLNQKANMGAQKGSKSSSENSLSGQPFAFGKQ